MRVLTCGADGILVELADLDETLRVFAALQSAVKHAVEQTAESPERAAQPSATAVFFSPMNFRISSVLRMTCMCRFPLIFLKMT